VRICSKSGYTVHIVSSCHIMAALSTLSAPLCCYMLHCPHASLYNTCCVVPLCHILATLSTLSPCVISWLHCPHCLLVPYHGCTVTLSPPLCCFMLHCPHASLYNTFHIVSSCHSMAALSTLSPRAISWLHCHTVCTTVLFHAPLSTCFSVQYCPHCLLVPYHAPLPKLSAPLCCFMLHRLLSTVCTGHTVYLVALFHTVQFPLFPWVHQINLHDLGMATERHEPWS
jgi:hypothetical protein